MLKADTFSDGLQYMINEGFKFNRAHDMIFLLKDKAVCFSWCITDFSYLEMLMVMYATLVEPPLLYN